MSESVNILDALGTGGASWVPVLVRALTRTSISGSGRLSAVTGTRLVISLTFVAGFYAWDAMF